MKRASSRNVAPGSEPAQDESAVHELTPVRVEQLPKEAGWLLITAGVVGLVVPGVLAGPATPQSGRSAGFLTIWSGVIRAADRVQCSNIGAMVMPSTRTFSDVTAEILSRMKEFGRTEYGIVYDPPEGPVSTATSQTPLGECVIEFAHDPTKAELSLGCFRRVCCGTGSRRRSSAAATKREEFST
jgi:hypothetical protein